MKVRDSGMPNEEVWESLFDIDSIIQKMELMVVQGTVVDLGCGYGTFTIPVARNIQGEVIGIDLDRQLLDQLQAKLSKEQIQNVILQQADFMADGTRLKNESADYVMLFNILHTEEPVALLTEAKRILKKHGKVGIIHWNYDPTTPRGPNMEIRPRPEQCIQWTLTAGFQIKKEYIDLKPYHYGIIAVK